MRELGHSQLWSRLGTPLRSASAVAAREPNHLAALTPLLDDAQTLVRKSPSVEVLDELDYLLHRMDEIVAPWRPSPVPSPGVIYVQPSWAVNADREIQEALRLFSQLRSIGVTVREEQLEPAEEAMPMKVFVSHSGLDKDAANAFVHLLRAALPLSAKDIRCTSVDGYRLPPGTDSDEQLRREVFEAQTFVALLSPNSLASIYVMFELGARWGTKKSLLPIMIGGLHPNILKPPVSAIHAVNGTSEADVHQLIETMAEALMLKRESAAAYLEQLRAFTSSASHSGETPRVSTNTERATAPGDFSLSPDQRKVLDQLHKVPDRIAVNTLATVLGLNVNDLKLYLDKLERLGFAQAQYGMNQQPQWWITTAGTEYLRR